MKFLFVHSWHGFSLAQWSLHHAIEAKALHMDFRGMELHAGDLERQDYFFQVLSTYRPSFVGFSCFFWNYRFYQQMAAGVKALLPECTVIFGGPQVNSLHECEKILNDESSVDYILRGMAEDSLPLLLESCITDGRLDNIGGLSYLSDSGITHQAVVKEHKWNRGNIFNWHNHALTELLSNQSVVAYETLRGCRYSCSYCEYPKSGIDLLDLDIVTDELAYLCELDIPHIRICDAHFGGSQARAKAILKKIASFNRHSSIKIYADLTHIDEEYLQLAADARVEITSIGIQTTNRQSLKMIKRPELHRLDKAIHMILEKFPDTPADLIVGLPGDDAETTRRTFADVLKLGFSKFNVFRLAAYPGTMLTENLTELLNGAVTCGDSAQVFISENLPAHSQHEVVKLVLALDIAAASTEVKQRLAEDLGTSYLLDYFSSLDATDLLQLHDLIFKSAPQALLNSLPWITEQFSSMKSWGIQCEEAMVSDLLLQQYHKCIRGNISVLKNRVGNRVHDFDSVIYLFRNGRALLWDLQGRGFYLNPDRETLKRINTKHSWMIDPGGLMHTGKKVEMR